MFSTTFYSRLLVRNSPFMLKSGVTEPILTCSSSLLGSPVTSTTTTNNNNNSNIIQKRYKSRGNTYQPSTLKRKRKFGFIARMKDKFKIKMIKNRKAKGRWFLSH